MVKGSAKEISQFLHQNVEQNTKMPSLQKELRYAFVRCPRSVSSLLLLSLHGSDVLPIFMPFDVAYHVFELTILDSESDPQKAAQHLTQLFEDGTLAVIGGVTTAEALAMVPAADLANRVLLSPSASSPELTGISEFFFRVFFSDFDEGIKMGHFAAGNNYSPHPNATAPILDPISERLPRVKFLLPMASQ